MMSADEMKAALSAIKKLAPHMPRRRSRRWQECTNVGQVAIRAALRAAIRQSGLVLPKFQSRKTKARQLVILCDVSGSMEQYSRVLLHFIHSLTQHHPSVHSFLFGTHLSNITRLMRYRDVDEAVQGVSKQVDDWSGGTLIGHNLQLFNREWSRRVMAEGASVILVTDGLDCGQDEYTPALQKLHFEIERLHKSAYSLIWLNPLLRFDGFEPKSQSIRTMLPHVDHFLPMHSLQSIYDLANSLRAIGRRRSRGLAIWQSLAREAAAPTASYNGYAQMKGAYKNGVVT